MRHLYLHNCSLKDDFPFDIVHLPHLETLDLSQNKLTIIPDSFCMTGNTPCASSLRHVKDNCSRVAETNVKYFNTIKFASHLLSTSTIGGSFKIVCIQGIMYHILQFIGKLVVINKSCLPNFVMITVHFSLKRLTSTFFCSQKTTSTRRKLQ